MRTKGTPAELECRRRVAWRLLQQGKKLHEVADAVGASMTSVKRWKRAAREGGEEALAAKPHPGPTPRLNPRQKQQLAKILLRGPIKAGYRTDLWTCKRIAAVVAERFGQTYHPSHIWKILHSLDFTPQLPEGHAREQDVKAAAHWRRYRWPVLKRGLAELS